MNSSHTKPKNPMNGDTILKSLLVHSYGCTYFFDIRESQHGSKYVVIRENKIIESDPNQIIIGKENLRGFLKALHQLLPEMDMEDNPVLAHHLA